jgi:NAD(P)-dependent dehydrogenase (short-subunit alcohol dehydrogenase family)
VEKLQHRVAVVTGSAGGIGLAITEAFLAQGMRVVLADVDADVLHSEVERLSAVGDVLGVPTDVRDPASVDSLGRAAIERFGAVHVAVNNAGISVLGNTWEMPLEEWHRIFDVNFWGVLHGIRTFVPLMLANGEEGHVVNTASMASVTIMAGLGAYTATKHALLGMGDVLRVDLKAAGAPIGVSTVMPGMTRTRLNQVATRPPTHVAANVVDAILNNRQYVYTDEDHMGVMERRLQRLIGAQADTVVAPE